MSTTWRQHLVYDAGFSAPNRWILMDGGAGIRVRWRFASEPEHVLDLPLKEARMRLLDSETFCTAPLIVPECAGRVEFILRGAPEPIVTCLREALDDR